MDLDAEILNLANKGDKRKDGSRAKDLFGSSSSSSEGEVEVDDGYDEDLLGDAADRARLAAMTEVEREKVLFERAQARQAKVERIELARRVKALEQGQQGKRPARAPSSQAEQKRMRLEELRERRSKRRKRRARGDEDVAEEDIYTEEGEVEEGEAEEQQLFESDDSNDDDDEDVFAARRRRQRSAVAPSSTTLTFELANQMQLTRQMVEKWQFHHRFDELAKGMVGRLNVGKAYRPVEIKRIVTYHRTYQLGNTLTNKAALMRYGKSERTFCLEFLSNAPITEAEWQRWQSISREEGTDLPPFSPAKVQTWQRLESEPVDDETVSRMVAQRKQLGLAHRNLMAERTILTHQLEEAKASGNEEESAHLAELLGNLNKEIEQAQAKRQPERLEQLAQLNKRNREANVSSVNQAQRRVQAAAAASNHNHTKQHDPFSRRKIVPSEFPILPDNVSSDALIEELEQGKKMVQQTPQPPLSQQPDKKDPFSIHNTVDINIDI